MVILRERQVWRRPCTETSREPALPPTEQANVKAAIRLLRHQLDPDQLARALKITRLALKHTTERRRPASAKLALRVARVAGVPLEEILSGAWRPTGVCPVCGRG